MILFEIEIHIFSFCKLITLIAFPIFNAVYFKKKHYEQLFSSTPVAGLSTCNASFDFHFGTSRARAATSTATNSREVQQRMHMHAGMLLFTYACSWSAPLNAPNLGDQNDASKPRVSIVACKFPSSIYLLSSCRKLSWSMFKYENYMHFSMQGFNHVKHSYFSARPNKSLCLTWCVFSAFFRMANELRPRRTTY